MMLLEVKSRVQRHLFFFTCISFEKEAGQDGMGTIKHIECVSTTMPHPPIFAFKLHL
jgi:hypothetical protein